MAGCEHGGQNLAEQIAQESEVVEPTPPAFDGLIEPEVVKEASRRWRVTIRRPGKEGILLREEGNLNTIAARNRIKKMTLAKLSLDQHTSQALAADLEQYLLNAVSETPSKGPAETTAEVEYEARVDPEDPEKTGFYAVGEKYENRLTNFVMRIDRDILVEDFDEQTRSRRFSGTIRIAGQDSTFDISHEQYAKELQPAVYAAAGPKAEFRAPIETIRTAIAQNSEPQVRRRLTSPGWNPDGTEYIFPGGYVDQDGCHLTEGDAEAPVVELPANDRARWLGLRPLSPEDLLRVKRHILDVLMTVNDRNVVSAMLSSVVLPIVMRPSGIVPWPLVWFSGLTGSGKSLLASLGECFYGDFGGPGSGRHMSWKSTFVAIQTAGYSFRDAFFMVDDYKPEDVKHNDCSMVLQCYGDRTGRSRGRPDATLNTTRAIRGLLVCTGEDFPRNTASGRGRAIVVPVPAPERDFDRVDCCLEQSRDYPGWTAAFITHVIRKDLGRTFQKRVDHWRRVYLERIQGRANDARLAANHACLAAAFELFAEFMVDVWGEAEAREAARTFAEEYVMHLVRDAAGEVETNTTARIFLNTLSDLLSFGRVRIEGIGNDASEAREGDRIIGRLLNKPGYRSGPSLDELRDETPVIIATRLAIGVVNENLDRQARPRIQVSEAALVKQLAALGCLLDPLTQQPIGENHVGERTKKARISGDPVNAICVRVSTLRGAWSTSQTPVSQTGGSNQGAQTLRLVAPGGDGCNF